MFGQGFFPVLAILLVSVFSSSSNVRLKKLYDRVKNRAIDSDHTSPYNFDAEIDFSLVHTLIDLWVLAKHGSQAQLCEDRIADYASTCSRQMLYLIFSSYESLREEDDMRQAEERLDLAKAELEAAQGDLFHFENEEERLQDRFTAFFKFMKKYEKARGAGVLIKKPLAAELENRRAVINRLAKKLRDCEPHQTERAERNLIQYIEKLQTKTNLSKGLVFELCREAYDGILVDTEAEKKVKESENRLKQLEEKVHALERQLLQSLKSKY